MASSIPAFATRSVEVAAPPRRRGAGIPRRLLRNRAAAIGLLIVGTFVVLALSADWLPLRNPLQIVGSDRMAGPSWSLPMGADTFGRDLLSRVVYGARLSLSVAVKSVAAALLAGTALGLIAGYAGGWFDQTIMRGMDILFAFPAVLLALGIVAALGPNPDNVVIAIAIVYTPIFARVVRGPVLALKEREFVEAARALGARASRIIARHVLPNLLSVLIVQTSIALSWAVLTEASLSFLGLSAQPPAPSWGVMLNEGRQNLELAPHLAIFPGLAIMLAVLGFNLLGDGLRDVLDPRLRT
ncbi:MAG TPA: ABC transporter permease [Chloroflexota bacterium]|jgi:peptide/nickel transport system permease protein|nr:ABC transporter permease [Chloroflexota bacterium]